MSHMIKQRNTQKQLPITRIRNQIFKTFQSSQCHSLFQKLQAYDQVIKDFTLDRTDPLVLQIFQEIVQGHGDQSNDTSHIGNSNDFAFKGFSSPTNLKRQYNDIQDPELFSFSKTRKQSTNKRTQITQEGVTQGSHHFLQKQKKLNSDKPRYIFPTLTQPNQRKVSQFNSHFIDNEEIISKGEQKSLHLLSKELCQFLQGKNLRILLNFCRNEVKERKMNLKKKMSEYIYEIKLLRQCFQSIRQHNKRSQQIIQDFVHSKNQQKLLCIFEEWYNYSTRSQEQRLREKQIKVKRQMLLKFLGIHKFINNIKYPLHGIALQQRDSLGINEARLIQSQKMRQKISWVVKLRSIGWMKKSYDMKKQESKCMKKLQLQRLRNAITIFNRLTTLKSQITNIKHNKLTHKIILKVSYIRFVNNLKKEHHFQKVYWKSSYPSPTNQVIDMNYQKIAFLYMILDYCQHSQNRKGYSFLQNQNQNSLMQSIERHPAYQKFLKPFLLKKYFCALKKELLVENKKKSDEVKYGIHGHRVLKEGLLCWYKSNLQKKIRTEQVTNKQQILSKYLIEKNRLQFIKLLEVSALEEKKVLQLQNNLEESRTVDALMILKTYTFSKAYYRKVILKNKLMTKQRTLQSYFLEWRLYCVENVHNRLIENDILQLRKRSALKRIKANRSLYHLNDKIFNKKAMTLLNLKANKVKDVFIVNLRRNWNERKGYSKLSTQQLNIKSEQLQNKTKAKRKAIFMGELMEFWFQNKLQRQIFQKIDSQYNQKLMKKCLLGLSAMRKYQKVQKQRETQLRKKHQLKTKKQVIRIMIDKMIESLILKKLCTISKKYWFGRLKTLACQQKGQESGQQMEIEDQQNF